MVRPPPRPLPLGRLPLYILGRNFVSTPAWKSRRPLLTHTTIGTLASLSTSKASAEGLAELKGITPQRTSRNFFPLWSTAPSVLAGSQSGRHQYHHHQFFALVSC
jgi:hypothetical protein